MIIISDTSPIANLIVIKHLEILKSIFEEVIVPEHVDKEIRALANDGEDISSYENADWISSVKNQNVALVNSLLEKIDPGESAAIALAIDLGADLLLIDERKGTRIAKEMGLQTIGLLGAMLIAKKRELIDKLGPLLEELEQKAGFWMSESLKQRVLAAAGE
ncbi:MAG: DUF3368 domain-containing protein [Bacteroidota bacterium]